MRLEVPLPRMEQLKKVISEGYMKHPFYCKTQYGSNNETTKAKKKEADYEQRVREISGVQGSVISKTIKISEKKNFVNILSVHLSRQKCIFIAQIQMRMFYSVECPQ